MEEPNHSRVLKITMGSFPDEIKTQILSMLPVKDVLRCRSVCKAWKELIGDHRFAALHLDREIESSGNRRSVFLFSPRLFSDTFYIAEQHEDDEEEYIFKTTKLSLHIPETNYRIVGSVNGLCCFFYYDNEQKQIQTLICNPVTQQFVKLPELVYSRRRGIYTGFGYDPLNKKFKVLTMICPCVSGAQIEVHVFTLRSSTSWKKLDNSPNVSFYGESVALNGSLYWLTKENYLLSFDLASEDFGLIAMPKFNNSYGVCTLTVVDGCLCIVDTQLDDYHIWVLRTFNVKESWTQSIVPCNIENWEYLSVEPVSFWKDVELLLRCDCDSGYTTKLVSYNLQTGTCAPVRINGLNGETQASHVIPYQVHRYCGNLTSLQATDQN